MIVDYRGKVRGEPAVLASDGSIDGASMQTTERTSAVQWGIVTVLHRHGALSDGEIRDHYDELARIDPNVPRASESGLRTRRAELVRRGTVIDTGRRGRTAAGVLTAIWDLRSTTKKAPKQFALFESQVSATPLNEEKN